jgi:hypothetical protein
MDTTPGRRWSRSATPNSESDHTMKVTLNVLAGLAVAGAIGAAIVGAPDASAAPLTHPSHEADNAPGWPQYDEMGIDPMVPTNTGAFPFVIVPPDMGRAF